ncbi:methyltransferase domain-containing protein [Rhodococcoides yunnanense]|uniref:methyltransferase domain-containing protein n=1 Tax=Rhodococcoides yunnanense TaxID=278209 RepID=UPI0009335070|nr:class I SAM-dependent methyltransferase [Rhodococcus yunnanensis]
MTGQQGYDAIADIYASTFPTAYQFPIERHAVAAFAEVVGDREGVVVDVGCGVGHVTADLVDRGLAALGCDPSAAMLDHARRQYPELTFIESDAGAALSALGPIAAIIARFSLVHLEPASVAHVLGLWSARLTAGTPVLIAFQASDERGAPILFDHAVAPAWRWHPDEFAALLGLNGFHEDWRIVHRDNSYRFPMAHLLVHRALGTALVTG